MFIEDENWNDEPGAKAPSTGNAVKRVQKANSLVKPKGVGRKSLLQTLKTLGSLPDMKSDALQEDSDWEKETVPTPHTKRKKKRSKRQKQAGASEKEAENGDSSLADTVEKNQPENLKKNKELKYVKKDFDNGENTPTSSELNEQKGENTHTVNRKQWRNKMKNKKKCKNKFRQNKPEQHLNKAGTPEQQMTEETKPTGPHCNNYTNAAPQAAALKHKPKKRKRAEEEDEHPSLTPDMQTIIEDEQLTKKEMKNKTSNKVEKGVIASKQATGKKVGDSQEPPKPMKKLKLEMSKEEKQKRDKLRKVLNRQEPTKQENLSDHGNEDDAPHLEQDVKESLPDRSAALRSRMMQRLESARFRYINEVLYTTSSEEAKRLFKQDPEAFEVYHKGFTAQVQKWPSNPVDAIVSYIRRKPSSLVVADFGCGDCKIARCVKNKVHSFDLAPVCHLVTVCDMANVPLDDGTVDIAVFCLSLMGTNLADFLAEANRVLVMGGVLKIAEVASRFENLRSFLTALASLGFKLSSKDTENSHFFSFEFMKTGDASGNVKKLGLQLNPCLYKKR